MPMKSWELKIPQSIINVWIWNAFVLFVYIIMFLIITNVIFTRASFIILFSIKFNTPRFLLDHVLHWLKWIVLFSCKINCNIYHKKGKKIKGYKTCLFFIHFQNNSTWQPWQYQQQQFPNLCFSNVLCLPIVLKSNFTSFLMVYLLC